MIKKFDYEIVYEYLKNSIKKNINFNNKIPSENELCEKFNLTRATVRQGISKLKNEGLIFSKKGSGCFVAPRKINYILSRYTTFSHEVRRLNKVPGINILEMKIVLCDDFLLAKFNFPKNQKILQTTLIRTIDGFSVVLGKSYINLDLTPNIKEKIASTDSFTKIFKEYGLEPMRNNSELEIVSADSKSTQLLQIQNNLPLIKIASISTDKKSGQIIEYVESCFRSDMIKISIDFNQFGEVKG